VVLLHSFQSLASRPICLRPALNIGGLSCVIVVVSCFGVCIGQMCVAMSWYPRIFVMTCAAAKSMWSVLTMLAMIRLVSV